MCVSREKPCFSCVIPDYLKLLCVIPDVLTHDPTHLHRVARVELEECQWLMI